MYQKIAQKLVSLLEKSPKGKADISFENARAYANAYEGKAHVYKEQCKAEAPPATWFGGGEASPIFQNFKAGLEVVCLESTHTGFRFCHQHLITPENKVICRSAAVFESLPVAREKLPFRVKKLKGTIAYLSGELPRHYGYWMRTILPVLEVYKKCGVLDQADYFYIGDLPNIPSFVRECFEFLNISPDKIIYEPCRGDKVLFALTKWEPQPNGQAYIDKNSYAFVRNLVTSQIDLGENCCYSPRVYITRGKTPWRQVHNQQEVFELLRKYDFEFRVLDKLTIYEQAQIFYHADTIIAPHGGALTNLLFGKKDHKVLEIFAHNHLDKTSYELAAYSGMQYFYMQGNKPGTPEKTPHNEDIVIDLELLDAFCQQHL